MNARTSAVLAFLGGIAIVYLVPYAAALLWQAAWTTAVVRWAHASFPASDMPQILLSGMFPVFVVAFAVGALVFRLPARTQTLFALVAAPFVSYSLFMNVGLWVVAGNSITEAISRPFPWLIAAAVPLALLLALLLPGPRMRSDA